ncbi:cytochrome P450 [Streptomyces sp. NPDC094448]|uniref:cytochrome P450 n=1 Tax=Streptomyces sp. NPDC094448 TaxID=3366063 RepID=UPI00380380F2
MPSGSLPADGFSHNRVQYIEDPFPFYALMREQSPAHWAREIFGGAWLMFRHEDCARLMQDERLSNARADVPLRFLPPEQRDEFADLLGIYGRWLAFHDGKEHTRGRRLVNRGYAPFTDEHFEPRIQRIVDELLDRVDPAGFDLIADFAFPLPAMVIADVLGVPVGVHQDLNRWTDDIAHLFGSTSVPVEHLYRTRESTRQLAAFLASESSARLSRAKGGLLHRLRQIEVRGSRLSEPDVVAQAALLLFAGVASIRYLIGNSVHALDSVPATERELLLNPPTARPAVEELLRVCTPVSFVGRVAGSDFDYTASDGTVVPLREGQPLLLYIASANRDPDVFDRPDELVLDRPLPNRHLTFGIGRHLCFGDPLVRQTTRIALSTLYTRWPELTVPPQEADWNNNLGFHGFTSLRVTGED